MQIHCYRFLGSLADAEDALQETLAAAWRGLAGFEGRASFRTWLYRIATNRCLNLLRTASRPPAGLFVITLAGERVSAITRFDSGVFARFGLPRTLAD